VRLKPAGSPRRRGLILVKDLFAHDAGSPATGLSPWKFLGDESAVETKPT